VAEKVDAKREYPNLCPAERFGRECPSRKSGDGRPLGDIPKLVAKRSGLGTRPE